MRVAKPKNDDPGDADRAALRDQKDAPGSL